MLVLLDRLTKLGSQTKVSGVEGSGERRKEGGREGGGRKYCFFSSILYLLYCNIIINFFNF